MKFSNAKALLELMRPLEWSKNIMNMVLGSFLAIYFLNGKFESGLFDIPLFFIAIGAVILLWSGLYALNDFTDWKKDSMHPIKKLRPIPSKRITPKKALVFAVILIIASFFIAAMTKNNVLLASMGIMLANQFFYTMPVTRFKERPVLDLISGSIINPIFRFYSGWGLFANTFNAPILYLVFVVGLQFGGYTLYRLGSKGFEKQLKMNSSASMMNEKRLKKLAYLGIGISGLVFLLMALNRFIPMIKPFGILPLRFLSLFAISLLLAPLYYNSMRHPTKMNLEKTHKLLYYHLWLFILGIVLLFALF